MNNFIARLRYQLARRRKRFLEIFKLSPGHWKWAAIAILIIMGLIMAGMAIDIIREGIRMGMFVLGLLFLPALALLAGLGVRLALKLLNIIPERQNWIFFGLFFTIMFLFGLPDKARIILVLYGIIMGLMLGAGIYNLGEGRWKGLRPVNRVLTIVFIGLGSGLLVFAFVYLLYPGKPVEAPEVWSMKTANLPVQIEAPDPSQPGTFAIDSLTYGWGKDRPRKAFGSEAELLTEAVDGSNFLDGWEKFSGKMRSNYWKMGPDSLALNGSVWFPVGDGPFPLVLMVHGNHLDRDFSDTGYDYLGRHFASRGIIAVSVDENFLNGAWSDFSKGLEKENDCRGWLLLKHLELWRNWNQCDTIPFYRKVDMDRIVLIGHSRGGEAVSVACCFNALPCYPDNAKEVFDFNFKIRGIAAIAPVDGQYSPAGIPTPLEDVNYFTIQGSMDADLRSYDGLRQMRRVQFRDSSYHFASGLYLNGANHGQFNRSWGIFDNGYPNNLLLNRKAIIPVKEQEQVALVYLSAFVLESCYPGSGYLPLFKDYRTGRDWLPGLIQLNQFHESDARIFCDYEEDLDLTTGSHGVDSIVAAGLALYKEGRIPKKWGDYRNNAVFLGWNNEEDSIPGSYTIYLDSAFIHGLDGALSLTFLAADAQVDPGDRDPDGDQSEEMENEAGESNGVEETGNDKEGRSKKNEERDNGKDKKNNSKAKKGGEKKEKGGAKEDEDPEPIDFKIVLTDTAGLEFRLNPGDYQMLQPAIKPPVFKARLFWEDPESEVIQQYVSLPLAEFRSSSGNAVPAGAIRSISFVFDAEEKGTLLLDQVGFSGEPLF